MRKRLQLALKWSGRLILCLPVGFLLVGTAYHLAYQQRIYPGVTILGQPLGNKTLAQAETIIRQLGDQAATTLTVTDGRQQWTLDLVQLEREYFPRQTARRAYEFGRGSPLWSGLVKKVKAWFSPRDLSLDYSLNQSLLEEQITAISQQVYIPIVEPTIKITSHATITTQPGQAGRQLDRRHLFGRIDYALSRGSHQAIPLPLIQLSTQLNEQQIKDTQNRAQNLLNKKLTLANQDEQWQLTDEELIGFLDFVGGYQQGKISQWIQELTVSINRPAQNALFQFLPGRGRVVEFKTAQTGQSLDETKTKQLMIEALIKLETDKSEVISQLPVTLIEPQITTADANNLGIKELIGQGVSYYAGSSANRTYNLALAANKLNGILIPPGETFSFNQSLGEISQATGFKQAYIIKEGRTILDDGGGVCQTSTSMFRAALAAGLPIIERRAHAYRVRYYEQQYQPGFDATVFNPSPDLKFKNDTPVHILIQTLVAPYQAKLAFNFYGAKDGRIITISQARTLSRTAPPPDLYIDDSNLPTGQTKQIEHKIWGAKVAFDYRVTRGQETLQEKTFWSHYQPWQAVYLRGTGG